MSEETFDDREKDRDEKLKQKEARSDFANLIDYMQSTLELREEYQRLNAKILATKFQALINEGMERGEALQIICARGID